MDQNISPELDLQQEAPPPPFKTITVKDQLMDDAGRLTLQAQVQLEQTTGGQIRRIGGGSSKEVFSSAGSKIVSIINTAEPGPVMNQVQAQIRFYQEYTGNPLFNKVIVPMTDVIQNETKEPMGMIQPAFGISLEEYQASGKKPSKEEIDRFSDDYKKLVDLTGIAHGDFVIGALTEDGRTVYNTDWGNIRVGANGELRFIDYNGRNGNIVYRKSPDSNVTNNQPGDPDYSKIRDSDPERTKTALYQRFGYD